MTDRELLELAAKAAELRLFVWGEKGAENYRLKLQDNTPGARWTPLTDDGDALRLAVKLLICVKHDDAAAVVAGWTLENFVPFTPDQRGPWYWKEWLRDHDGSRESAARRAIVCAAAEFGKSMMP
jgi:hypothetical protein